MCPVALVCQVRFAGNNVVPCLPTCVYTHPGTHVLTIPARMSTGWGGSATHMHTQNTQTSSLGERSELIDLESSSSSSNKARGLLSAHTVKQKPTFSSTLSLLLALFPKRVAFGMTLQPSPHHPNIKHSGSVWMTVKTNWCAHKSAACLRASLSQVMRY